MPWDGSSGKSASHTRLTNLEFNTRCHVKMEGETRFCPQVMAHAHPNYKLNFMKMYSRVYWEWVLRKCLLKQKHVFFKSQWHPCESWSFVVKLDPQKNKRLRPPTMPAVGVEVEKEWREHKEPSHTQPLTGSQVSPLPNFLSSPSSHKSQNTGTKRKLEAR